MKTNELRTVYSKQHSFNKRAFVKEDEDGTQYLYSYYSLIITNFGKVLKFEENIMDNKAMIEEIEAVEVSESIGFTLGLQLYEYVDKKIGELNDDLHNLLVDAVAEKLEANWDKIDLIMDDKNLVDILDLSELEEIMDKLS